MKNLIEKHMAEVVDGEHLDEANYDNKGVYKEVKDVVQATKKSMVTLGKIKASKWAKSNKKEAADLASVMLKIDQVHKEMRQIAVGLGVMAGR